MCAIYYSLDIKVCYPALLEHDDVEVVVAIRLKTQATGRNTTIISRISVLVLDRVTLIEKHTHLTRRFVC